MPWIAFLSVFLFFQSVYAQVNHHDGLRIFRNQINYGVVEDWTSDVDSILVHNTSNKKMYLLAQHYPSTIEIKLPKTAIEPDSFAYIYFIYQPKNPGKFHQVLNLYHSNTSRPFTLTLKGEIKSLNPFYALACPSFTEEKSPLQQGLNLSVIDSLTGTLLSKSQVEVWYKNIDKIYYTDKMGNVQLKTFIGKHQIYVSHKGYQPKLIQVQVHPQLKEIIVTLVPVKVEQEIEKINRFEEVNVRPTEQETVIPIPMASYPEKLSQNIGKDTLLNSLPELPYSDFDSRKYKANNLVFVIDVSGSMRGNDRLIYVKKVLKTVLDKLREEDKISIIIYADDIHILFENKRKKDLPKMYQDIDNLVARGSTNGGNAIKLAYKLAKKHFINEGNNQVMIFTDGGFNGLGRSEQSLYSKTKKEAKKNQIYFSAVTVGINKFGKDVIEKMVEEGGGNYLFLGEEGFKDTQLLQLIKHQSKKMD